MRGPGPTLQTPVLQGAGPGQTCPGAMSEPGEAEASCVRQGRERAAAGAAPAAEDVLPGTPACGIRCFGVGGTHHIHCPRGICSV